MADWRDKRRPLCPSLSVRAVALWLVLGALMEIALAGARIGPMPAHAEEGPEASRNASVDSLAAGRRNAIVRAVEAAEPAVVTVSAFAEKRYELPSPFSTFNDPFFAPFFWGFRREGTRRVIGMGSGFIVDAEGRILTNEHVVHGASDIAVTLPDGRQFEAKLLGGDKTLDIAVLEIEGHALPAVTLGDSRDVILGEWAIAIGNPFGYLISDARPTVTVGVISALGRDFEPQGRTGDAYRLRTGRGIRRVYRDMIQTDAAINPGNSGGPLLNGLGEVIGMNTFIFSEGGGSLGIGFAIPINRARRTLDELLAYGHLRRPWTGLTVQRVDRWIARSLGLDRVAGVIVAEVRPKSPAQAAGVHVGDVILAVGDRDIDDSHDIRQVFLGASVGDEYVLTLWREGEELALRMQLTPQPE